MKNGPVSEPPVSSREANPDEVPQDKHAAAMAAVAQSVADYKATGRLFSLAETRAYVRSRRSNP